MRTDRGALGTLVFLSLLFAVFFLLPFAGLVDRAYHDGRTWELANSTQARQALWCSTCTSTVTALLAVLLGTPVAYLLAGTRFAGRPVVDAFIDLPIVLPPTVAGVALLTAFGRRGLVGQPIDEAFGYTFGFTTTAVIMAQLLVAAPYYVRAARAGLESVDVRTESVAYTLGASRTRTFFRIVLPEVRPALLAGIVLCWARSMGEL